MRTRGRTVNWGIRNYVSLTPLLYATQSNSKYLQRTCLDHASHYTLNKTALQEESGNGTSSKRSSDLQVGRGTGELGGRRGVCASSRWLSTARWVGVSAGGHDGRGHGDRASAGGISSARRLGGLGVSVRGGVRRRPICWVGDGSRWDVLHGPGEIR